MERTVNFSAMTETPSRGFLDALTKRPEPFCSKVSLGQRLSVRQESAMALTGKFRFRKTLWGKIVLQLEEEVKPFWRRHNKPEPLKPRWRDATLMDLAAPEVRP